MFFFGMWQAGQGAAPPAAPGRGAGGAAAALAVGPVVAVGGQRLRCCELLMTADADSISGRGLEHTHPLRVVEPVRVVAVDAGHLAGAGAEQEVARLARVDRAAARLPVLALAALPGPRITAEHARA